MPEKEQFETIGEAAAAEEEAKNKVVGADEKEKLVVVNQDMAAVPKDERACLTPFSRCDS